MKFIGHLFLQKLLSSRIIGLTLEAQPMGKAALDKVCDRLEDLRSRPAPQGCKGPNLYSKRICFAVQDMLEMKQNSWMRKTFKAQAKKLSDIRDQHQKEMWA